MQEFILLMRDEAVNSLANFSILKEQSFYKNMSLVLIMLFTKTCLWKELFLYTSTIVVAGKGKIPFFNLN